MKISKTQLKEMVKKELVTTKDRLAESHPAEQHAHDELVHRVSELFQRITELEKIIGVEWRGGGK